MMPEPGLELSPAGSLCWVGLVSPGRNVPAPPTLSVKLQTNGERLWERMGVGPWFSVMHQYPRGPEVVMCDL